MRDSTIIVKSIPLMEKLSATQVIICRIASFSNVSCVINDMKRNIRILLE